MGSSFFRNANPMAALDIPGRLAGNNSWLARMTSYDPVMQTGVGKVLAPNAYARGQQYSQTHSVLPNAYASVPGGGGNNEGYVAASQRLMNNANTNIMNGTTQRTATQGQPQNPGLWSY